MDPRSLLLVRHGQASFGKQDYDQLSPSGHRQARLLGADLARRGLRPDRIVCGGMKRHAQTIAEIVVGAEWDDLETDVDARWNELDHVDVIQAYRPAYRHNLLLKADMVRTLRPRAAFESMFEQALRRWAGGEHDDDYRESFSAFRERVDAAFDATVEATTGRTLVVTSAGCVSQIAARLTAAGSLDAWKEFALSISNTSVSRVSLGKGRARLQTFNEVSHLDAAGLVTLR